jgi:hypothetical protein
VANIYVGPMILHTAGGNPDQERRCESKKNSVFIVPNPIPLLYFFVATKSIFNYNKYNGVNKLKEQIV